MVCPKCNAQLPSGAILCGKCGTRFQTKVCPGCGSPVLSTANTCPHCGQSMAQAAPSPIAATPSQRQTCYCKFCGSLIDAECVVCPKCGRQVAELRGAQPANAAMPSIIINNSNTNTNVNQNNVGGYGGKRIDKIVALILCIFLGYFGVHKFYEGKVGMGILYLFTMGLFGIGWFVDIIIILCKPNPYYV